MGLIGTEIRKTRDIAAALTLGREAGLTDMVEELEGLKVVWGAYEEERLIGVVALRQHRSLDLVSWLAVRQSRRGRGVGAQLIAELEAEARKDGVECLWAMARAPGFFLSHGYESSNAGLEAETLLESCVKCDQYGSTCTPRAVYKQLSTP
jgi:N-acetylglutamate synthase-like GNAT family acetyltransferase